MKQYLTKKQVMEKTGWSQSQVEKLMRAKEIPFIKMGPSKQDNVRFLDSDIDAYFTARRVEAKTA